jgi:hypothetical protein
VETLLSKQASDIDILVRPEWSFGHMMREERSTNIDRQKRADEMRTHLTPATAEHEIVIVVKTTAA